MKNNEDMQAGIGYQTVWKLIKRGTVSGPVKLLKFDFCSNYTRKVMSFSNKAN